MMSLELICVKYKHLGVENDDVIIHGTKKNDREICRTLKFNYCSVAHFMSFVLYTASNIFSLVAFNLRWSQAYMCALCPFMPCIVLLPERSISMQISVGTLIGFSGLFMWRFHHFVSECNFPWTGRKEASSFCRRLFGFRSISQRPKSKAKEVFSSFLSKLYWVRVKLKATL